MFSSAVNHQSHYFRSHMETLPSRYIRPGSASDTVRRSPPGVSELESAPWDHGLASRRCDYHSLSLPSHHPDHASSRRAMRRAVRRLAQRLSKRPIKPLRHSGIPTLRVCTSYQFCTHSTGDSVQCTPRASRYLTIPEHVANANHHIGIAKPPKERDQPPGRVKALL